MGTPAGGESGRQEAISLNTAGLNVHVGAHEGELLWKRVWNRLYKVWRNRRGSKDLTRTKALVLFQFVRSCVFLGVFDVDPTVIFKTKEF